ncbi:MAG: L-rhamnose isomerase [Lentisphaeria bacterium]|nr:L-rhamnose isomerase [Lentisphaeria bacterium]
MFQTRTREAIETQYQAAKAGYAALGVDTDAALDTLAATPISLHCWQGDDVRGFEVHEEAVGGGGIMATGNYPGPALTPAQLRADAEKAFSLIPGALRFNLHAIYAETGGKAVERDRLGPEHFQAWMAWSTSRGICLDFNPTFFAHPLANDGYTLSHPDPDVRAFWVRHAIACRRIAEAMGRNQKGPCYLNHWIPDGAKDQPIDRWSPRRHLLESLDAMMAADVDTAYCRDAVESKLFGIGSEDYVVGSHEFYLAYVMTHDPMLCLDMGHFHPTETIHDKISSVLTFQKELLLHVSRGIRWDSDHVVILNDDIRCLFQQIVRGKALERTHVALDFFDASINRIGAWVVGTRAAQKGILLALLEPTDLLADLESSGRAAAKLALLEELKTFPAGAVWDMFCLQQDVPVGTAWIDAMQDYDRDVIRRR